MNGSVLLRREKDGEELFEQREKKGEKRGGHRLLNLVEKGGEWESRGKDADEMAVDRICQVNHLTQKKRGKGPAM